jgi:thiamine-monophosphate kinase
MHRKPTYPASENKLIRQLQARYPVESRFLQKGIGDDAAIIRPDGAKEYWVLTTDMLVEEIDFRREWTTPRQLGRKSISVNLSDLAAMGARPRFFTVSLAIPPDVSEGWILGFHDGMTEKGDTLGAHLIGGDLSRSVKHIVISISAVGETLNRKVLYRSGGRPGDLLYVTGILGRSAAGLMLLQAGDTRSRSRSKKEALQAHHQPEPRCETGLWLAQSGLVSCMMDLSDGLSMDLPRLCDASGTGAEIRMSALPVFAESASWGCDPVDRALHGGEDYELLFAVPQSKSRLLEKAYPSNLPRISRIGTLSRDVGNTWITQEDQGRQPLLPRGFDHFAGRSRGGKTRRARRT